MAFTGMGTSNVHSIAVEVAGDARGFTRSMDNAMVASNAFRGSLLKLGGALAAVGAAGALAIGKLVGMSREVSGPFREVTTLMESGQDAAEIYGDTVERLSSEWAVHGDEVEVIGGLYQTLSAGFTDAADATVMLESALTLATASLVDTETAVDVLTSVVNAYGLSAAESARVSDVLFETVRKGKTTMGEMAPTLGRLIPIAAELGVTIEEVGAGIATLTAAGQRTDVAVTSMRAALTQLMKPSAEAQGLIEELGFATGRAMVNSLGFAGTLQALAAQAEESGVEMGKVIPNVRAMQAVFPIVGSSAGRFAENLDAMNDSAGAAQEAFDIMSDSIGFKLRRATNAARSTLRDFGDVVKTEITPMVTSFADTIYDTSQTIQNLNPEIQAMGARMLVATTVVSLLTGSLILARLAAARLVPVLATVAGPVTALIVLSYTFWEAWRTNFGGVRDMTGAWAADMSNIISSFFSYWTGTHDTGLDDTMSAWDHFVVFMLHAVNGIDLTLAGLVTAFDLAFTSINQAIKFGVAGWRFWKNLVESGLDYEMAADQFRQDLAEVEQMADDFYDRVAQRGFDLEARVQTRVVRMGEIDAVGAGPIFPEMPDYTAPMSDLDDSIRKAAEDHRKAGESALDASEKLAAVGGELSPESLRGRLLDPFEEVDVCSPVTQVAAEGGDLVATTEPADTSQLTRGGPPNAPADEPWAPGGTGRNIRERLANAAESEPNAVVEELKLVREAVEAGLRPSLYLNGRKVTEEVETTQTRHTFGRLVRD